MKKLLTVITTLLISMSAFSQNDYQDLLIIKADGKWDDLIKKSERYTLKSSTQKDPVPYYYLAYGLYKISFEADRDDKYKNAYKDAYTAIGKMLRNDKDGEVQEQQAEFIDELKLSLLEIIQNEVENDEYRRAFGWVMRLYKFGRDYAPVYYLEGALRYRNNDKSTATVKWKAGDELIEEQNINSWSESDKKIFMLGLYESAKALKEDRQIDRAKEVMNIGAPYFEENKRWNSFYDEIVN
ncbi:MAG TPA: hypothetical protein VKY37_12745 [Brumimicrobium sp.]|nr:hypothetical protein [Brumimicrobium sp.]